MLCVGDHGRAVVVGREETLELPRATGDNIRCAAHCAHRTILVGNRGLILLGERLDEFRPVDSGVHLNLRRVAWSPDGQRALIVGNSGCALLLDTHSYTVTRLEGAVNNLRAICWPPSGAPLVVGNAYGADFVPTPNVYRVADNRLLAVAEEPRVDLLAADWSPSKNGFVAVGYDVVHHEARMYLFDGKDLIQLEWGEGCVGVYPSAVALRQETNMDVGVVATTHPGPTREKVGRVYVYRDGRLSLLRSLASHGFTCAAWSPDGSKLLLLASTRAKTFNV